MVKNYNVRLMCPYGDDEQWVLLQNREEPLKTVLESSWDFECPLHGVQRGFPLDARERVTTPLWSTRQMESLTSLKVPPRLKVQREPRFRKELRVWVRGRDRNGNSFKQTAYSVNVSRTGARLHGVGSQISVGCSIELSRLWYKARYRVVWAGDPGTHYASELGLSSMEPAKNFWQVPEKSSTRVAARAR